MTSYKKLYLDLKQRIEDKKQQEKEREKAEAEQKIKNKALTFTTKPHDFIYDETEKSLSWEVYRFKEGFGFSVRRISIKNIEKSVVSQMQKEIDTCNHAKFDIDQEINKM